MKSSYPGEEISSCPAGGAEKELTMPPSEVVLSSADVEESSTSSSSGGGTCGGCRRRMSLQDVLTSLQKIYSNKHSQT